MDGGGDMLTSPIELMEPPSSLLPKYMWSPSKGAASCGRKSGVGSSVARELAREEREL